MNDELTDLELLELETSMRGLSAVGNVNRDELLFEAGRRSANRRPNSRSGLWKGVSTVLALMLVGQSFLFWSSEDRQIADDRSARDNSMLPETDSQIRNAESSTGRMADNTDLAIQNNLPARRSELLELRRVALARGVDTAFSSDADDADHSAVESPTQQDLLRELLGS